MSHLVSPTYLKIYIYSILFIIIMMFDYDKYNKDALQSAIYKKKSEYMANVVKELSGILNKLNPKDEEIIIDVNNEEIIFRIGFNEGEIELKYISKIDRSEIVQNFNIKDHANLIPYILRAAAERKAEEFMFNLNDTGYFKFNAVREGE